MTKKLITFLLAVLCSVTVSQAQVLKGKRVLERENIKLSEKIVTLQKELDELKALNQKSKESEDATVKEDVEDANAIGAGLKPSDYTAEIIDSLLGVWYQRKSDSLFGIDELVPENMDEVEFSSNVPDKVMIERLKNMNSFITLPFNETVKNYIILYSEKMPDKVRNMIALSRYYFPIFEDLLNKYGMPEELKYMAIIESALNPTAVSRVNAKGMWQFMHRTGKAYGLRIDSYMDERFDPYKSADAAVRYMRDAYRVYGDWTLAISSYNCGPGNVNKAIRRSGSRQFWDLYPYLPRETRGYMPAFVGAMYAFTYYKELGLEPKECGLPVHVDTFQINKNVHFRQISDLVGIPVETLEQINPQYFSGIIPGAQGTCILRLPHKYTAAYVQYEDSVFNHKKNIIFNPQTLEEYDGDGTVSYVDNRITYIVKSGDYLGRIATKHHVTVNDIKKWNNLKSNNLRIGQRLVIHTRKKVVTPPATPAASKPAAPDTAAATQATQATEPAQTEKSAQSYTTHTVKSGDTLYAIALKYGVSTKAIMSLNNLKTSRINIGQKLKIPSK